MDWLANTMGIEKYSDLELLEEEHVIQSGASALLSFYRGSVQRAVVKIYPGQFSSTKQCKLIKCDSKKISIHSQVDVSSHFLTQCS
jgi:hypothetical protein